jgi:hypothetical protein
VYDAVVGSQRIETRYLYAAGFWSDGDTTLPPDSVVIHCYERFSFCEDAQEVVGGRVSLRTYDIVRWDNQELIAAENSPTCAAHTLRFDLVGKKVSISSAQKTDSLANKDTWCKTPVTSPAFLGGREDKIKQKLGKKGN